MRGAGGARRQRREHGSIKSRAQTDLELPVRGEDVSGSDGQELSFRAERGVCCAREPQRARFLATLGMTSSKRSQIIFVLKLLWFSKLVGTIKRSKLRCLELGPFLIASSLACLLQFPRLRLRMSRSMELCAIPAETD